jgi:CBS domain-containing protein
MIVSELEVSEVMTHRFLAVAPEDTLGEVAERMAARRLPPPARRRGRAAGRGRRAARGHRRGRLAGLLMHALKTPLAELRVADAMHPGVVSCAADTPLRTVARILSSYRIHAVVVFADHRAADAGSWSVVSDVDVLRAGLAGGVDRTTAGDAARTPLVMVAPEDTLDHAARLLEEADATHLIVVDRRSERPLGVLSTLDLTKPLAGVLPVAR